MHDEVTLPAWKDLQKSCRPSPTPYPEASVGRVPGAVIAYNAGVSVVAGIFICWVALFAPGILLIYGFMPWWGGFRHFQIYRR